MLRYDCSRGHYSYKKRAWWCRSCHSLGVQWKGCPWNSASFLVSYKKAHGDLNCNESSPKDSHTQVLVNLTGQYLLGLTSEQLSSEERKKYIWIAYELENGLGLRLQRASSITIGADSSWLRAPPESTHSIYPPFYLTDSFTHSANIYWHLLSAALLDARDEDKVTMIPVLQIKKNKLKLALRIRKRH